MVAIVGGSASGKTWLADSLARALGDQATRLSLDDFYEDRSSLSPGRRALINFDHPRAIDWAAFHAAIRALAHGRSARVPCYDFASHCRLAKLRAVHPRPLVIVDGLWLLHRRSNRKLFDYSIFLECSARIRLQRRLARDLQSRGRTQASITKQFRETVEPMHRQHVAPQAKFAKIILRGKCSNEDVTKILSLLRTRSN
jgi:uridine kinase